MNVSVVLHHIADYLQSSFFPAVKSYTDYVGSGLPVVITDYNPTLPATGLSFILVGLTLFVSISYLVQEAIEFLSPKSTKTNNFGYFQACYGMLSYLVMTLAFLYDLGQMSLAVYMESQTSFRKTRLILFFICTCTFLIVDILLSAVSIIRPIVRLAAIFNDSLYRDPFFVSIYRITEKVGDLFMGTSIIYRIGLILSTYAIATYGI